MARSARLEAVPFHGAAIAAGRQQGKGVIEGEGLPYCWRTT